MIEQDLWESWEASYLADISRDSMRRYWHDEHPTHLRDFMDFVDQYYRKHPPSGGEERDPGMGLRDAA